MKLWKVFAAVTAVLALASTTGCGSGGQPSSPAASTAASTAGKLSVTVAFYPFQFIAQRVGGDQVNVTSLTAPGSEPHDLELTPKQVAALGQADLVIFQKGFQPAVDTALQNVQVKATVDTASFLTLKTLEEEGEHAAEGEHSDEEDEPGSLDPHTWLDPSNMVAIAEHVRDALSAADPAAASTFSANTTTLIDDLNKLDDDYRTGLTSCQRTVFITSHEAFGYLAQRYGLQQVGIRGIEPDTEPTAARIAQVQKIARENKVTTIFFETLVSPAVAESVAGDLGLVTDVLDPLEGITAQSRGADYLEVMRSNLTALRKANDCS
ncbi:metal ABC transporter substrate-binding protein [Micropruina sp.]|uniref:metal ABC transporter substrate-binding protein n=1 Tax=Micropruina sp. TaxID=2737536 RepID=UPI0039E4F6A5